MERGLSEARERLATIVLVTWNSANYLPRCLAGIQQQTWPAVEVIAIDNASIDESAAILEKQGWSVVEGRSQELDSSHLPPTSDHRPPTSRTLIRNPTNTGFSKAVNQALRKANGDFVLLLNPDAYIERDYIERLIAALDAAGEEFGAATGRLMRGEGASIAPTDVVDSLGIRMTRSGRHLDIGQGRPSGADLRGVRELSTAGRLFEVFGVSGAVAMFRTSFIRDVRVDGEFLDEDFFAFREDADVAWRGRLFGWRALYVPDAVAVHVRTVTPERRREVSPVLNMHSVKNRFLLRLKNEGVYLALRNAPFELGRDLVALGAVLTIERTSLPALGWLWRNRSRIKARRREIQRRRRVSDRVLAGWFR